MDRLRTCGPIDAGHRTLTPTKPETRAGPSGTVAFLSFCLGAMRRPFLVPLMRHGLDPVDFVVECDRRSVKLLLLSLDVASVLDVRSIQDLRGGAHGGHACDHRGRSEVPIACEAVCRAKVVEELRSAVLERRRN